MRIRPSKILIHLYASFGVVHWLLHLVSVPLSGYGGVVAHGVNTYLGVASVVPLAVALPLLYALSVDRQYVSQRSDWTPSRLYYLMSVPSLFATLVAVVYVFRRAANAPRSHSE
jgi:hypothetical protein